MRVFPEAVSRSAFHIFHSLLFGRVLETCWTLSFYDIEHDASFKSTHVAEAVWSFHPYLSPLQLFLVGKKRGSGGTPARTPGTSLQRQTRPAKNM